MAHSDVLSCTILEKADCEVLISVDLLVETSSVLHGYGPDFCRSPFNSTFFSM